MNKLCFKITAITCALFFGSMQVLFPGYVLAKGQNKIKGSDSCIVRSNRSYDKVRKHEREKLSDDIKKNTMILDVDLEKKLNYAGMEDEDIYHLSDKDIEELQTADEINIKAEYFSETGKDMAEMSEEKIDEYYEEKSGETEEDTVFEKAFNKFTGTQEIKAETDIASYETSGGKFKHTLYEVVKRRDGEKSIYFMYSARWLEMPVVRGTDYFDLKIGNGLLEKGYNASFEYCKYAFTRNNATGKYTRNESTKIVKKPEFIKQYIGTDSYLAVANKLPYKVSEVRGDMQTEEGAKDVYYIVSGYAYQSNTGNKRITINAHYFHQKKVMSIAFTGVSVSFLPAGVSMGFSSKEQESYQLLGSGISTVVNVNNYSYK